MKIKVNCKTIGDKVAFQEIAAELLASILVKKLNTKELSTLITILEDDKSNITW